MHCRRKISVTLRLARSLILLIVPTAFAGAQEQRIKRSELPPAVEKTVAAESKHGSVRGVSQETEHGQVYYEAEFIVAGHHRDVLMDHNGDIVEVEEQVALDSLSPAVKDSLLAKTGKGRLQNVESLTKQGKLVAYEAQVLTDGKRSEVQVSPGGETLDHEE